MSGEPARLGVISLDFAGIPRRWDEHFPYENEQVGKLGKFGYSFLWSVFFSDVS